MNAISGAQCVMRDGVETYPDARILVNQPLPEGKTRISVRTRAVGVKDDCALRTLWVREDAFDARYRACETDEARYAVGREMSEFYHGLVDEGFTVGSDDGLHHGWFSYWTGEKSWDERFDCPVHVVECAPARMSEAD